MHFVLRTNSLQVLLVEKEQKGQFADFFFFFSQIHHDEMVRLYRTLKRDIEVRGGQENTHQDAQQQFDTWVVM